MCVNHFVLPQVLVGEHDLLDNFFKGLIDGAVRHDVDCIKDHPRYNNKTINNDFSILILKEPIDLVSKDSLARAACLPDPVDTAFSARTTFTVSGWGTLRYKGNSSNVLHHVEIPFVSPENCYNSTGLITDQMMCGGNVEDGGVDSCQGDSGGE